MIGPQTIQQGHAAQRPARVMQRIGFAQMFQPIRHSKDRSNPDAARNQGIVRGGFIQPKQIMRPTHFQGLPRLHRLVNIARPAAPGVLAQDGNLERVIAGGATQGIFAVIVAHADFDMGACAPAGQGAVLRVFQRQADDTVCFMMQIAHPDLAGDVTAGGGANGEIAVRLSQGGGDAFGVLRRVPFHPQVIRPPE